MKNNGLFSIDVDSHLNSAATHTFGSISHFPVELVRAALKRGAYRVDIHIDRNRITVKDDGSGLSEESIIFLENLLNTQAAEADKEEAIERLQEPRHYGLLAIFSPSPDKITIDNNSLTGQIRLDFNKGNYTKTGHTEMGRGTVISLYASNNRDLQREKEILASFCHSVPKDIHLNKIQIARQPLLDQYLAIIKLAGEEHPFQGEIAIPKLGNTCRLKFLDMGIPHRHLNLPHQKGYIFDAAIEYTGPVTEKLIDILLEYCSKLYRWTCQNYPQVSDTNKARIEELIFTHYKTSGDNSFIKNFSPFRIYKSSKSLRLKSIVHMAQEGPVLVIPRAEENREYNTGQRVILSLTQEQIDLLVNLHDIPLTFILPSNLHRKGVKNLFQSMAKRVKSLIAGLLPSPTKEKILVENQMSPSQQLFISTLNRYLATNKQQIKGQTTAVRAFLVSSKGPFPTFPPRRENGSQSNHVLLIRRDHPLVKRAIETVSEDPRNIEIVIPLLF